MMDSISSHDEISLVEDDTYDEITLDSSQHSFTSNNLDEADDVGLFEVEQAVSSLRIDHNSEDNLETGSQEDDDCTLISCSENEDEDESCYRSVGEVIYEVSLSNGEPEVIIQEDDKSGLFSFSDKEEASLDSTVDETLLEDEQIECSVDLEAVEETAPEIVRNDSHNQDLDDWDDFTLLLPPQKRVSMLSEEFESPSPHRRPEVSCHKLRLPTTAMTSWHCTPTSRKSQRHASLHCTPNSRKSQSPGSLHRNRKFVTRVDSCSPIPNRQNRMRLHALGNRAVYKPRDVLFCDE
eukprot:scaffold4061_cov108-Cylindrotheca_fusiformis.AAC.15